jgi:hypothetical protein
MFLANIFVDGDIECAMYSLILLELQRGPLAVVQELLQGLLQIGKDADF